MAVAHPAAAMHRLRRLLVLVTPPVVPDGDSFLCTFRWVLISRKSDCGRLSLPSRMSLEDISSSKSTETVKSWGGPDQTAESFQRSLRNSSCCCIPHRIDPEQLDRDRWGCFGYARAGGCDDLSFRCGSRCGPLVAFACCFCKWVCQSGVHSFLFGGGQRILLTSILRTRSNEGSSIKQQNSIVLQRVANGSFYYLRGGVVVSTISSRFRIRVSTFQFQIQNESHFFVIK